MRYSVQFDKRSAEYIANNIGISALKYVLGQGVSRLRRFVWLLVILLASAWMIWNIQGRVNYFLSRPSAITTEMKFKDKLMFPKVTICNQNMFRSSKVFENVDRPRMSPTVYEAVDRYLFSLWDDIDSTSLKYHDINKYDSILSDINVTEFYKRVSHQKTTLIQRCVWKGELCGPENFTEVFTNMGVCYQFSISPDDRLTDKAKPVKQVFFHDPCACCILTVVQGYKDGGLTLDLFIEQYDYMRDPQTQAGALVVITDHNETEALAKEQGIGVSVGQYVSIGLQQRETIDLPPPHGECGTTELDNYPDDVPYSYQKCHLNCLTSFIKRKCGCVSVYMPGDDVPKCTLLRNVECVTPNEELFYLTGQITQCTCPSPCESVIYSTLLSLVKFSNPFRQESALLEAPVSLSDVNRARYIHAWALLNILNPDFTDHLAKLGIALDEYKKIRQKYYTAMDMVLAEVQYLMDVVSEHDLVNDMMMGINPQQEANITRQELHKALQCIKRNHWESAYGHKKINSWMTANDDMDIDFVMVEDFINHDPVSYVLFEEENVQESIACFLKDQKLFFNCSLAAIKMQDLNLSHWNSSSLTQDTLDLVSEMDMVYKVFDTKTRRAVDEFENYMNDVREVALRPYRKFTSSFYSDNLLKIEIYFKDLGVQESKKSPSYSAEGLVCDIGGSIGLCLGGSILTLVELFDIIAVICGERKKKRTDLPLTVKKEAG
ncbi:acid-sensing ion channel 2-like [Gigantopelta aegis]|uniref:acid-sensing ion channel 2-like n=1 Tax=Gigantopelta aegis TaxID=1735272 RepID=UPI001B88B21E|nr:acid-sensing ion channel 2-like [Gigantopelta aegis]